MKNYSYFSTLSNSVTMHFFEWIPGPEVSGEKKLIVSDDPIRKSVMTFMLPPKNRHA